MLLDRGDVRTMILTYHTPGGLLVGVLESEKRVTAEADVTNLDQAPWMNKKFDIQTIFLSQIPAAVQYSYNIGKRPTAWPRSITRPWSGGGGFVEVVIPQLLRDLRGF